MRKFLRFSLVMLAIICSAIIKAENISDVLTASTFPKVTGTAYDNVTAVTVSSNAVYSVNLATNNRTCIQLRSKSNSGIVSTISGGVVKSVTVVWDSSTDAGRTIDIYAKNTAYSAPTDLYNTQNQGTKIGEIVNGTSTKFEFEDGTDYNYIGLRSKSGALYATSITIEWQPVSNFVAAPTITGETPFEGSSTVTLTAEDGASIYYTTDDSDPTTASTPYSSPFTLNESATVKAIAVKDGKTSSIASKEFTKVTFTGATIADLNEYTDDKAYINLTLTNAKVVYVDGKNIHLRENGKALMMYATNMTGLTLNATVSGTIKVDYDNYNGIHEVKDNTFTNTENLRIDASSSEELDATETTISALLNKEHISDLVVIKNVSITTPDNSKYYVSDGTNEIQLWGNVEISKASVGKTTDVYALYNTIYQGTTPEIKPVSIDGVTTGINKVEVSKSDSKLYNTAGQRVDSAYKGIVIKNGKKVLVK